MLLDKNFVCIFSLITFFFFHTQTKTIKLSKSSISVEKNVSICAVFRLVPPNCASLRKLHTCLNN